MKYILICLLFLVGCTRGAISKEKTNNTNFEIEYLFTKDNCKMYRFYDGRSHYFTTCGETIGTYSESCGKNCTNELDENIRQEKK